jgi:hypothetical protein
LDENLVPKPKLVKVKKINLFFFFSYDKWIKEQIVEILKKPKRYTELVKILEINNFESKEMTQKSKDLRRLLEIFECWTE